MCLKGNLALTLDQMRMTMEGKGWVVRARGEKGFDPNLGLMDQLLKLF